MNEIVTGNSIRIPKTSADRSRSGGTDAEPCGQGCPPCDLGGAMLRAPRSPFPKTPSTLFQRISFRDKRTVVRAGSAWFGVDHRPMPPSRGISKILWYKDTDETWKTKQNPSWNPMDGNLWNAERCTRNADPCAAKLDPKKRVILVKKR
jgi:hypothetical protein